jgi:hypothetical protein
MYLIGNRHIVAFWNGYENMRCGVSLTSVCEHFYLTKAEVILITPIVSDVHVTSLMPKTIITDEQDAWILETAFECSAWFVQSFTLRQ